MITQHSNCPHPILTTSIANVAGPTGGKRLVLSTVLATVTGLGLCDSASAFTIAESATAPTTDILASQLTDSTGPQFNDQDYIDNGGPPGQTFTIGGSGSFQLNAFTILGRGDDGGGASGSNWGIQIGSVNTGTGAINSLLEEASPVTYTSNSNYLTFNLATPVVLNAGTTYAFSVCTLNSASWYGLAHSTNDIYAGGTAFNNDETTTQGGNEAPRRQFNGFVSARAYDFVFAAHGVAIASTKTWSGQVNGNWDTATTNFTGQAYVEGDNNLTFGDLDGVGAPPVTRNVMIQAGGVSPGANLIVSNSTGDYSFTGSINGTANNTVLTKSGSSNVTLAGTTDNTGLSATVVGGTMLLNKGSSATVHAVGNLLIGSSGTARLTGTGGDQIADTGTVTVNGTLDLNGLNEGFDALIGSGTVTTNTPASTSTLTIGTNNGGDAFGGAINNGAGTMEVVKVGSGNAIFNGYSDYTGNLTINGGTVTASAGGGDGTTSALGFCVGGRAITVNGGATMHWTENNIFIGGGGVAANLPTIVVNEGTFSSTRFNVVGNLNLNGATLTQDATDGPGDYEGYQFIGDVTVGGTAPSTISTGNGKANHLNDGVTLFTVGDATSSPAVDLTISSPLRDASGDYNLGPGSLTKAGPGTMALTATNSYTGATSVTAGTLLVSGSIAGSAVSVASGATLGGIGGTVGPVSVADGGAVSPGEGLNVGTLNTGDFSLTAAGALKFKLDTPGIVGGTTNDLLSVTGNLTLDGTLQVTELANFAAAGTYTLFTYTGTLTNNTLDLEASFLTAHPAALIDTATPGMVLLVVPEPTAGLLLFGGLGLMLSRRRRKA